MRVGRSRPLAVLWLSAAILVVGLGVRCQADILAADYDFNRIYRFDDKTGLEKPGGVTSQNNAGMQAPSGLAVGPDGNIYVSSKDTGEILRFDGETGLPMPPEPAHSDKSPGFFANLRDDPDDESGPGPLRFGPDGNLYVSDFGGSTVRVFNPTGVELAPAAHNLQPPGGIAFKTLNEYYVGAFGTNAIIRIKDGVQTAVAFPSRTPSSLIFAPNGDLLSVSMYGNKVLRYDVSGPQAVLLGEFAVIAPTPTGEFSTNFPSDIAYDADGNLILAVLGETHDSQGQLLRYRLNEGSVAGTLDGIFVDDYPPLGSVAWINSVDAIVGDYNGDLMVDALDYAKWRGDFGKVVAVGGGADGNGNGIVDAADYGVWRNAVPTGGAAGTASVVPEPHAILLLAASSIPCATRLRRRLQRLRTSDGNSHSSIE